MEQSKTPNERLSELHMRQINQLFTLFWVLVVLVGLSAAVVFSLGLYFLLP